MHKNVFLIVYFPIKTHVYHKTIFELKRGFNVLAKKQHMSQPTNWKTHSHIIRSCCMKHFPFYGIFVLFFCTNTGTFLYSEKIIENKSTRALLQVVIWVLLQTNRELIMLASETTKPPKNHVSTKC